MIRKTVRLVSIAMGILAVGLISGPAGAAEQLRVSPTEVREIVRTVSLAMRVRLAVELRAALEGPYVRGSRRAQEQEQGARTQEREEARKAREQERQEYQREREQQRKERGRQRALEREERRLARQNDVYDQGTEALDDGKWEKALAKFDQVATGGGSRADAALYWKAYALNRLGRRDDSLAALAEIGRTYPQSRWLADAKALEVEVRQSTGEPVRPENEPDCELKLLAINGLRHSDAEKAVPMLQKFLQSMNCPKSRKQALFVLAQSGSPQARETLGRIARGQMSPDLQRKAVEYLALFGGKESRQVLSDVYGSSHDVDVRRAILRSFMISGERDRLLAAARTETVPELRREAIRQLGVMASQVELWQLYQVEPTVEIKEQIIQALFVSGSADKLAELARAEKAPELRRKAIRNLGLLGAKRSADTLVNLYGSEKDKDVRREVLNALFLQGNAKALVEVAKKEPDPELKKTAIQKLSLMRSKEATDFMLELLNK